MGVINGQFGMANHPVKYLHLLFFSDAYGCTKAPKTRNNHGYIVLQFIEDLGEEEDDKPGFTKGLWIHPTNRQGGNARKETTRKDFSHI